MSNLRKMRRSLKGEAPPLPTGEAELVQRHLEANPDVLILSNDSETKMSEILKAFAEPILSSAETYRDLDQCFKFAMLAWNYSLVTPKEQRRLRAGLIAKCPEPIILETFDSLIVRKLSQFADIQRLILEIELCPDGDDFRLNVISSA